MKNKYEIIIFGRGGQGAKTSAEILAQAALREDKHIQAFPDFGPERSGAPVRTFVRISDEPILTHEPIVDPDCFLILDESLLENESIVSQIKGKNALLIINTPKDKNDFLKSNSMLGRNIVTVDASGMSKEIIGEERPNTIILGKFAFATEAVRLEDIVSVFRQKYQGKLGKEKTEKNIKALRAAYDLN